MSLGADVLTGPTASTPLAGVARVRVLERLGEPTTFTLSLPATFADGDIPALSEPALDPGQLLTVRVNGAHGVVTLVHGPAVGQRAMLLPGGGASRVEVHGSDLCAVMDREHKVRAWADTTDGATVTSIAGEYGLIASGVETTTTRRSTDLHVLVQRESDLRLVRRLARRNGFLFWLTSDVWGTTAHFGTPPTSGNGVLELRLDPAHGNIGHVELSWDSERPTSVTAGGVNPADLAVLDGTVTESRLAPSSGSLAQVASGTRSTALSGAADDAADLTARGEALLMEAGWWIRARCETSRSLLGDVVRAHTRVDLAGIGRRFSGTWLVASVEHDIDGAEHRMAIELVRNGWEV